MACDLNPANSGSVSPLREESRRERRARTSLVVAIREDKKHILQDRDVKLTEEDSGRLRIRLGHVVHEFQAHCKASVLHFSIVVLAGPHAGINDKLELCGIKFKQCWETVKVDRLE